MEQIKGKEEAQKQLQIAVQMFNEYHNSIEREPRAQLALAKRDSKKKF